MTDRFWGPFQFFLEKAMEPESEMGRGSHKMTHTKKVSWNLNNISIDHLKSSLDIDVLLAWNNFYDI